MPIVETKIVLFLRLVYIYILLNNDTLIENKENELLV